MTTLWHLIIDSQHILKIPTYLVFKFLYSFFSSSRCVSVRVTSQSREIHPQSAAIVHCTRLYFAELQRQVWIAYKVLHIPHIKQYLLVKWQWIYFLLSEPTVCSLAASGLLLYPSVIMINARFHGFLVRPVHRRCSRCLAGRVRSGGAGDAVNVVGGCGRLECWLCRLEGCWYGGRGRCRYDSWHIWNTTITRLLAYARKVPAKKLPAQMQFVFELHQALSQLLTWMLVVLGSHDLLVSVLGLASGLQFGFYRVERLVLSNRWARLHRKQK